MPFFRNAAQLPNIAIVKPGTILSRDTVSGMQAGLVYGYLGQVDFIIRKMKEEIGRDDIKVIATGGYGRMFLGENSGNRSIITMQSCPLKDCFTFTKKIENSLKRNMKSEDFSGKLILAPMAGYTDLPLVYLPGNTAPILRSVK